MDRKEKEREEEIRRKYERDERVKLKETREEKGREGKKKCRKRLKDNKRV